MPDYNADSDSQWRPLEIYEIMKTSSVFNESIEERCKKIKHYLRHVNEAYENTVLSYSLWGIKIYVKHTLSE